MSSYALRCNDDGENYSPLMMVTTTMKQSFSYKINNHFTSHGLQWQQTGRVCKHWPNCPLTLQSSILNKATTRSRVQRSCRVELCQTRSNVLTNRKTRRYAEGKTGRVTERDGDKRNEGDTHYMDTVKFHLRQSNTNLLTTDRGW